jgi:flagellar assembly factor FliW
MIEVEEDAVYEFPDGIYGFEGDTRFAIFPVLLRISPFYIFNQPSIMTRAFGL